MYNVTLDRKITRAPFKLTGNIKKVHTRFQQGKQTALINSISKIRWTEDVRDFTVK